MMNETRYQLIFGLALILVLSLQNITNFIYVLCIGRGNKQTNKYYRQYNILRH